MSRLHTNFVEVKVHTAKCDSCEKHNKLTLYRCTECGQHVCSLCWNRSGDRTHIFGGGFHDVPVSNANPPIDVENDADGEQEHENEGRKHARRRAHVISDDEDDDHHEDREHDMPRLWPIVPARKLPVLRPAEPATKTNANEGANRVTQRNSHIHRKEYEVDRQITVQDYDGLERQAAPTRYVFFDEQITRHVSRPNSSSISHQQVPRSAPLQAPPAVYRPRLGEKLDQQVARNQDAFASSQPTNRQASGPAQPLMAHHQTTQLAPHQIQRAVYRPRPGADLDQQVARNQLAFADHQCINHQAPQSGQASVSHQEVVHPAPRLAQASISQRHAPTAANMDQVTARNQQAFRLNQQAQAYTIAKPIEARNRQALSSHQNAPPAVNRDQVATHNQQTSVPNRQSPSAANYVKQRMEARDQQQAYLSRQQASRPTPGPAQTSVSHLDATSLSPFPADAFLSQQHATLIASRQAQHRIATQDRLNGTSGNVSVQKHSPEVLAAADALLLYAEGDQNPRVRFRSDQDTTGVSRMLSAAGQLDKASSASLESRSSSKTLVGRPRAAETRSVSGPALNTSPGTTDADSAEARPDKHRAHRAGSHTASGTHNSVSDLPVSPRGHLSYGHAVSQPDSGPALADSSAAQSHNPSFRRARSQPGPRLPVSDHAATYLKQWDSGRTALSSSSSNTGVNVPTTRLDTSRSPVPALHPRSISRVQDITFGGSDSEKAAEARTRALSAPDSVPGGPNDIDVVMNSPDAEICEDDKSRHSETLALENNPWTAGEDGGTEMARTSAPEPISGLHAEGKAEKHQRGEKKADCKTSKEHKVSGDVDVVDARKRNGKAGHSGQSTDDGSDIGITSWNNLDSNKTTAKHRGTNARVKGPESVRTLKKGVAHVKKPESKGQKGKTTATRIG